MATVTVVNAERTLEIEATSIVSGVVNSAGHLILTRHDGTDLDMGAVSGMQLDSGTSYSKVDAFTYVGDTDPGAVSEGSVWLDTNDVAGPFASDTQKGLVELATSAETISGTDNTRAVTPEGFAAGLAAVPGNKVQILAANANTETALPSAYPLGISQMVLTTGSGWSINSGFGSVVTYRPETDRTVQHAYSNPGGIGTPRMWQRQYHTSNNGGGWTVWAQVQLVYSLTAANFAQTTNAFSGYPTGWSRLYYTTANSTNWDFAGMAGEVLTYVEGTDFAKQTFTEHVGGSTGLPDQWVRTATAAGGWTPWRKPVYDNKMPKAMLSGKVLITPSAANTPTAVAVSFPAGYFSTTPNIVVGQDTTVPGTQVTGVAAGNPTATGFNAIVTRTNTTATWVQWIATEF